MILKKTSLTKVVKNILIDRKEPISLVHFVTNRCNALRANNEQCTRRRKEGCEFCGTHTKGTPHGLIQNINQNNDNTKKHQVYATEVQGIVYYIDNNKNVYNTEDIMNNISDPQIIATYEKKGDTIIIPKLGLV